jgi:putative cardiolipin synthase
MWRDLFRTAALVLLACSPASAVEYPWLEPANTQVILVKDAPVDVRLRLSAIDHAQHSIDCVVYSQGADPAVGLPVLRAFRRAQERGVRGRYLFSQVASLVTDPSGVARLMLADANLKRPGEVIWFGGLTNWLKGLRITDMIHEKILIIDAGTPDEIIWIGGRNHDHFAEHDLDLGIILRRVDPTKPYLGDQLRDAFESVWTVAGKITPALKPKKYGAKAHAIANGTESAAGAIDVKTDAQRLELARLRALLAKPPQLEPSDAGDKRPRRMRVVTNDLLQYVLTGIFGRSMKARERMPSDIVDAASPVIAGAKQIYISAMSIYLPDKLKQAIKEALAAGAEVHLITNSRESHRTRMVGGVAYDLSLRDIVELMGVNGNLSVYVLDDKLIEQHPEMHRIVNYLHRKVVVADDHVFTGSDNYNRLSQLINSEMIVHVQDAEWAATMRELMKSDLAVFTRLTCEMALTESRHYGLIKQGLNRLFLPFY